MFLQAKVTKICQILTMKHAILCQRKCIEYLCLFWPIFLLPTRCRQSRKSFYVRNLRTQAFSHAMKNMLIRKIIYQHHEAALKETVAQNKFVAQHRKLRKMLHVKIVSPFLCREKVIKGKKSNKAFGMIKVDEKRWGIYWEGFICDVSLESEK